MDRIEMDAGLYPVGSDALLGLQHLHANLDSGITIVTLATTSALQSVRYQPRLQSKAKSNSLQLRANSGPQLAVIFACIF